MDNKTRHRAKFKDEFVAIDPSSDINDVNHQISKICKVIKFTSEYGFNKILSIIPNIKNCPNLFIFVFEVENFGLYEEKIETVKNILLDFSRAIIIQIVSKIDDVIVFYYKDKDCKQFCDVKVAQDCDKSFKNLDSYLKCFATENIEDYENNFNKILPNAENSTLILRFLRTLDLTDKFYVNLIYNCAKQGSKDDFLAALDAPFEGDGRFLNPEAEAYISNDKNEPGSTISILYAAIKSSNDDVVNYLITHCTHLIQLLSFEHRIDISTTAFDDGQFEVLCDLLEYSDFPFPRNIANHPISYEKLRNICMQRMQFHEAIRNKNEAIVKTFVDNSFNNKIAYDINNQSALYKAISSKNFEEYCRLKSLGFRSESTENCDEYVDNLTKHEKDLLSKQENIQTKINADHSVYDSKKSISLLSARSLIHNRKITKAEEVSYRKQIVKWLEELYKIELCKALLDAAAQCEDLKIIFDFESISVENVDLKGKGAGGTTYTAAKYIFIAAKLKHKDREQNIKGVLIHEICHYVMRLVYENKEEPYYKNDTISKKKFDDIVSAYNKFSSTNERIEDKCGGIISSVYTLYAKVNHSAELIVRPPQILAFFDNDDEKSIKLQIEYKLLFDYITDHVLPELKLFDLRHRSSVRKFNKTVEHLDDIMGDAFEFSEPKQSISSIVSSQSFVVTTNVPKLFLSDLVNNLKHEYLLDTKNIFIRPQDCENQSNMGTYCTIMSNNKEIRVIVDCSKGMGRKLQNLLPESNLICVVSNVGHSQAVKKLFVGKFNKSIESKQINYRFCDLTQDTQLYLLETNIQFQNEDINLLNLMTSQAQAQAQSEHTQVDGCFQEIVDGNLLKLLVEESTILINGKFECEKYFQALYRPRSLIKLSNDKKTFNQEDFLETIKNERSVIISDIGGNGKSWILKSFAIALRKQKPAKWVSYIHLKMFENIFDFKKSNSHFLQFMTDHVLNFGKSYERAIFKSLYKTGNCCVLFDGFDELSLTSREFVKELMTSFKYYGGNQIWVTTKDSLKEELQTVLQHKVAYKPAKFTEQDAIEFIKTTWMLSDIEKELKHHQESEILKRLATYDNQIYQSYAENLVSKIFNSKFKQTGLPNICKIAADLFKDKDDKSLVYSLNVDQIYGEYVKNKYQDWSNGPRRQSNSSTDSETFHAINEYQAIKNLCPMLTPVCDLVYKNVKFHDDDVIACGLSSQRNDNIIFQHDSFNEYFILSFIVKLIRNFRNIVKESGFDDMIGNLIVQFFNSRKFDIFRSVTDNMLKDIPEIEEVKQNFLKFFGLPAQDDDAIDFLFKCVGKTFDVPQTSQNFVKLTEVINNCFGEKKVVKKGMELLQAFPEMSNTFNSMANKFIYKTGRKLLYQDSDVRADLTTLSALLSADFAMFSSTFSNFMDRCSDDEQSRILMQCDKNHKNILYMCVEKRQQIKLKFLWEKIEGHFQNFEDFRSILTRESLPFRYNVFHAAVVYGKNLSLHEAFWPLAIESFKDQSDLMNILLKKDINGNNVAHLLLLENKSDVIEYVLIFLRENLQDEFFKEIVTSKNVNRNNLIHVAIIQKYELPYLEILWNIFSDTCDTEFMNILKQTNVERNNVFQLAARFSSKPDTLKFMIEKLESSDQIKMLLKNKDSFNRNILQSAARQNESLNCHEYLWEIIEEHFDCQELIQIINNRDNDSNNVLHSAVSNNINEIGVFILKKVQTILESDELVKYLKLRGNRHKNLKKLSLENTKDHTVVEWVENIIGSIYSKHPFGSPITVLTVSKDRQLTVNNNQMQKMFNHSDVKDRQIVVISIIGGPKKGKSFLLNYCLRYLYGHYPSLNHPECSDSNSSNWIDDEDEPLVGFNWNVATKNDESSAILWNDVFLPKCKDGQEKTAIIIMDTQNGAGNGYHMFDFAALFSSKLIINLSGMLRENNLGTLKDEIEAVAGNLKAKQRKGKPFQNCTFLIRDWDNLANYKTINSNNILDKICSSHEGREVRQIKMLIEGLYDSLSCQTLSYPGRTVESGTIKGSKYDGNWGEMDVDFRDELFGFIESELKFDRLVTKKVNGTAIKGPEFLKFIELQFEAYQSGNIIDYNANGDNFLENKASDKLMDCIDSIDSSKCEAISEVTNFTSSNSKSCEISEDYTNMKMEINYQNANSKCTQLKPNSKSEYLNKSPVELIMEFIVSSLIEEYEDLIQNQLETATNISDFEKLQESCKMEIIEKYIKAAKIINEENKVKYKIILCNKIKDLNEEIKEKLQTSNNIDEDKLKNIELKK